MSETVTIGSAGVPEVERLRNQLCEEEDRSARLSALLEQARDDADKARRDRDAAIMERATYQRRADRDRWELADLRLAVGRANDEVERMRRGLIPREPVGTPVLRVGAIVGADNPRGGPPLRGVVLVAPRARGGSARVWWPHVEDPDDGEPCWEDPRHLAVLG